MKSPNTNAKSATTSLYRICSESGFVLRVQSGNKKKLKGVRRNNMQDIPRNELLDKLAAGWKVRRNNWAKDCYISKIGSSTSCHWFDLLKDEWEGEPPPELMCVYCELPINRAFTYLKEGKHDLRFVRRKSWPCTKFLKVEETTIALPVTDLIANDWEVWG